jgi:hypothetical protein
MNDIRRGLDIGHTDIRLKKAEPDIVSAMRYAVKKPTRTARTVLPDQDS